MSRSNIDKINLDINNIPDQDSSDEERARSITDLMLRSRHLSALSVLYAQATSDSLGLNLSDLMCLGTLSASGPITAGQLASLIGLSTGSVTGLVDRLERLDLVHRERDKEDRRRVTIHFNPRRAEEIRNAFVPMLETGRENLEQFADDELAVIRRYIDGATALMRDATRDMRQRERTPILPPDKRDDLA